ncbi:Basic-leucine zipper domain-containing protein [Dioscorea alata]|uniref:Basic-leucine zipper domain-containing protein n=1 Tax=Dioscorea alata TaxID=55571 RepID=A0ACB7VZX2_DIOAL|nr:Basic-leucine zipper domain-containing protein [Dioscorea alata]
MSRPAHLPPRCPSQSRLPSPRVTDSSSQSPFRDDESQHSKHRRSPSQGSTFDDLLTNLEATPRGLFLRRASSDPTSIMEVLDNPILSISVPQPSVNQSEDAKTGCGFEADYVYGPNSPRQKGKLTQSESSMVSALLETVPQNPLQYLAVDVTSGLRTDESDIISEDHSVGGDFDSEKARRRHSGQRSRVRKLQYIAELEKTVDALQTLEAELAAKVEALSQDRVALSIENKKLKWQLLNLHQEKIRKDCQYLSLKNEVDKLKMVFGKHRRSKSSSFFEMSPVESDPLILDMGKLSLASGNPVPLRHGFNH